MGKNNPTLWAASHLTPMAIWGSVGILLKGNEYECEIKFRLLGLVGGDVRIAERRHGLGTGGT